MRGLGRVARWASISSLGAGLIACAGPSASSGRTLGQMLADQDYAQAQVAVESERDSGYGTENAVLYNLDLGLILHYAGKYEKSSESLAKAEDRMVELYTKSLSRETGALLANENVKEYAGEKVERALAHAFHALNYSFLNRTDEALVEARRAEADLDEVRRTASPTQSYQDDAFVHYLCALIYDDARAADDARISFDAARKAYARYAVQYGISLPTFEFPSRLEQDGELVFLHYDGPAPRKIAQSNLSGGPGGAVLGEILNVSFPRYAQDKFEISSSAVETGADLVPAEVVEDVYAVASRDLDERAAALKARSVARAALKLAGQALAGTDSSGSEFADVRGCRTLPSRILMARVKLKPGRHQLTVRFVDAAGAVLATQAFQDVLIRPGRRTWLQFKTAR